MKSEAVVGAVVGVAATFITANVLAKMQKLIAESEAETYNRHLVEEIDKAKFEAYNEGWNKMMNSRNAIYNRFVELFGQQTADELAGTTLKESRKR